MKFVSILVGVVVVIGVAWYFLMPVPAATPVKVKQVNSGVAEVEVTKTDIAQNGISKLPVGFPKDIPVEVPNISESYRAVYASRGVTQYTVSYTSLKTREALWTTYSDFMNSAGYAVDKENSSKSLGQITGTKDNDTLSVVLSTHGGLSLAQLNFLDR